MAETEDISADAYNKIIKLVNEASGHPIVVMGDGGRIIASSDPARVGTVHDGARRIMAGEVNEIAIDAAMAKTMHGVRPGYTGPVHIDGKLVVCIGVGGDPAEVKQLQKMAALALRQEIDRERMAVREKSLLDDVRRDIGDIAERMQILSLNGAVLAARLGEKGRGFKIVVGEMRNLAAQIGEKLADLERREKDNAAR